MRKPVLRLDQYLSLFLFSLLIILSGAVLPPNQLKKQLSPAETIKLIRPNPVPVIAQNKTGTNVAQASLSAILSADAAAIIDINSGAVLFDRNIDKIKYPASTTKLMTALVALEYYDLNQVLTVQLETLPPGQVVELERYEQITVRDLLAAILINSGNDAAFVLANNYPGGVTNFVQAMNDMAEELNLNSTRYVNPAGFDEPGQVTTARDLAILTKESLSVPIIRELVNTKQMQITDLSGQISHQLVNTNQLLGSQVYIHGVKTGTTELAKQVLVTLWTKNGHKLLVVVMDSQDRYTDTRQILAWLERNINWINVN